MDDKLFLLALGLVVAIGICRYRRSSLWVVVVECNRVAICATCVAPTGAKLYRVAVTSKPPLR